MNRIAAGIEKEKGPRSGLGMQSKKIEIEVPPCPAGTCQCHRVPRAETEDANAQPPPQTPGIIKKKAPPTG